MSKIPLSDIRTEYKKATLDESDLSSDPIAQFQKWFNEVMNSEIAEPNAMTLATVNKQGIPSARIVLLKKIYDGRFCFFTNYESQKGSELSENPNAALVFFWKELERQVRVQGKVSRADKEISDEYYFSRPYGSQIGAWASQQSQEIAGREILEDQVDKLKLKFEKEPIYRPSFWGGFCLKPVKIEFWQGRPSRLHDRIVYTRDENGSWTKKRLSP